MIKDKKDKTLYVKISDKYYAFIEAKAASLGLSISDYVRMVCLCADIKITVDNIKIL